MRRGAAVPFRILFSNIDRHAKATTLDYFQRSLALYRELADPVGTADLLLCLVEEVGRVLSREQILKRVWGPGHHGTPRTIDNFMLQLRAKLEDDPGDPAHLVTVRGVGYRFQA